ncbi:hypothetical protein KEM48_012217 [Puccinia striiformis f. sp. tritici PST-130]|nr:hypothetical protein H4Q26_013148 [Puccinia striiformis f. sp. tritici PST-130]KAI9630184.1 hypothetical protein KEM48_012217 [Puccinia striiformis f. sp. tritici PST-130]
MHLLLVLLLTAAFLGLAGADGSVAASKTHCGLDILLSRQPYRIIHFLFSIYLCSNGCSAWTRLFIEDKRFFSDDLKQI